MSTARLLQTQTKYSVAQYLELEETTGEKWEFFDGEVFPWEAMAGSSPPHAMICSQVGTLITNGLNRRKCNVFNSDLKLGIRALRRYRYPDLSVVCGNVEDDDERAQAILNPTVLVEVTSKSSFEADYTSKAQQYMQHVPSLREYLIVVQHEPFVTLHSRVEAGGEWVRNDVSGLEGEITIPSIRVSLAMAEIYLNIAWRKGVAVIEMPTE